MYHVILYSGGSFAKYTTRKGCFEVYICPFLLRLNKFCESFVTLHNDVESVSLKAQETPRCERPHWYSRRSYETEVRPLCIAIAIHWNWKQSLSSRKTRSVHRISAGIARSATISQTADNLSAVSIWKENVCFNQAGLKRGPRFPQF